MGVRSSVVVPILHHARLWGLLVSHHSEQREVTPQELQFIQVVIDQLEIAIAQSALLTEVREQAEREACINQFSVVLHRVPSIQLETALAKIVEILHASSGRLYLMAEAPDQPDEFCYWGEQPRELLHSEGRQVEQHLIWQRYLQSAAEVCSVQAAQDTGEEPWSERLVQSMYSPGAERPDPACWAINDLYAEPLFRTLALSFQPTQIRGMMIVPLRYDHRTVGCLTLFRNPVEIERLWAGHCENDRRQHIAQISFEAWRELKQGQAEAWTQRDKKLAQDLAAHFVMAVQQFRLYRQIQTFNVSLEQQVRERTLELEKTLEELQQAQTQLVQTEKMSSLGQLVAGVAHEINNPINFIHGNMAYASKYAQELLELVQLYQQRYPDADPELRDRLEEIDLNYLAQDLPKLLRSMEVGTERIRDIVKSLRTFSRLDEAEFKAVNLHDGIDSTLMLLGHRLKGRTDQSAIELIKDYGELPLVECYPGQLNQVFMNLFSNAIDALEACPKAAEPACIRIQTRLLDHARVEIRIADNGSGMSDAVRSRLFNPFFTTKPIGAGTGLGLSISYQIVTEGHQGKLFCESTLGHGAEFIIQIPLHHSSNP